MANILKIHNLIYKINAIPIKIQVFNFFFRKNTFS